MFLFQWVFSSHSILHSNQIPNSNDIFPNCCLMLSGRPSSFSKITQKKLSFRFGMLRNIWIPIQLSRIHEHSNVVSNIVQLIIESEPSFHCMFYAFNGNVQQYLLEYNVTAVSNIFVPLYFQHFNKVAYNFFLYLFKWEAFPQQRIFSNFTSSDYLFDALKRQRHYFELMNSFIVRLESNISFFCQSFAMNEWMKNGQQKIWILYSYTFYRQGSSAGVIQ